LKTRSGHHFCGGTILDSNHVLSAAHCGIEPRQDKSTAGTVEKSGTGGSTHIFEKCTKHPQAKKGRNTWEAGKILHSSWVLILRTFHMIGSRMNSGLTAHSKR